MSYLHECLPVLIDTKLDMYNYMHECPYVLWSEVGIFAACTSMLSAIICQGMLI